MDVPDPGKAAKAAWSAMPRAALEALDPEGDFAKRHLLNPTVFRMLGDVRGRRVLDAGAGQGYFSRLLADRGAHVVSLDAAESLVHVPNCLVVSAVRDDPTSAGASG